MKGMGSYLLQDFEGSDEFVIKFLHWSLGLDVPCVQPNLIALIPVGSVGSFSVSLCF